MRAHDGGLLLHLHPPRLRAIPGLGRICARSHREINLRSAPRSLRFTARLQLPTTTSRPARCGARITPAMPASGVAVSARSLARVAWTCDVCSALRLPRMPLLRHRTAGGFSLCAPRSSRSRPHPAAEVHVSDCANAYVPAQSGRGEISRGRPVQRSALCAHVSDQVPS